MKLSKTVLVNVLVLVAGIGTYILDHDLIVNNPDAVALVGLVVSGVNLALRYLTSTPMVGWFVKA
jgi:hypothetical protein